MWSKLGRQTRLLLVLCCVALLVLGAVLAAGFLIPYSEARNTMDPEGLLVVLTQEDGTLKLHWTEGSNATTYGVQVLAVDGQELYSCTTSQCHAYLPQLPEDRHDPVRPF